MQLIEDLWQFLKAETLLGNCLMLFKYMKLHGMHLPKGEKKTEKRNTRPHSKQIPLTSGGDVAFTLCASSPASPH